MAAQSIFRFGHVIAIFLSHTILSRLCLPSPSVYSQLQPLTLTYAFPLLRIHRIDPIQSLNDP